MPSWLAKVRYSSVARAACPTPIFIAIVQNDFHLGARRPPSSTPAAHSSSVTPAEQVVPAPHRSVLDH